MDASYKIQRGIHVHLIQFFMCPEFWVHIKVLPSSFAFSKFRLSVLFVSFCQTVVERLRSERNLACPAGAQEGRHQGFHPLIFTPFLR